MCPQSPECLTLHIDDKSSDEELILFLGRRRAWDPIPGNVITEVKPFSIDPRNSPEGIWFLYSLKDSQPPNEGSIIKVTNGYWSYMNDHIIIIDTHSVGRKSTREFFAGEAPFGDRTGWRMHEYWTEELTAQGNNKSQDDSALCRFFLQNDGMIDNGDQSDHVGPADADGEYIEHALLSLIDQEERNCSLKDAANGTQVVGEDKKRQLESSSRPYEDLGNVNCMEGLEDGYDFSNEDFLELKDLYDPESSATSSDNSSLMSMNSDECFDAEGLLRDIENDRGTNMEEHADHRFNISTSVQPNQVVIQPPPPAFNNNSNVVVDSNGAAITASAPDAALPSSVPGQQSDSDGSTSGSSQGSHGGASHSGSSHGSSESQRSGRRSVRRMAKLGKRYCCFGSF